MWMNLQGEIFLQSRFCNTVINTFRAMKLLSLKKYLPLFCFFSQLYNKRKKAELRLLSDPLLNSWWWKCPLFLQSGNSNLCAKIFFSSLFFLQYSTEPDKKHSFSSFTQFQWIHSTGQIISEYFFFQRKILQISALAPKEWTNQKTKALYYNK